LCNLSLLASRLPGKVGRMRADFFAVCVIWSL
jgi:hypothetical protein